MTSEINSAVLRVVDFTFISIDFAEQSVAGESKIQL